MSNLSDFLKCEKVRCVSDGYANLNKGSEYNLVRLEVVISNNAGLQGRYPLDDFEPVLETAIQATDSLDDTPMGTRTVNEFEIGDRVYCLPHIHIYDVQATDGNYIGASNGMIHLRGVDINLVCHATPENYERLSATFENITFEAPPKELTGSDLCRAMLDKGWNCVPCYVSSVSDKEAISIGTEDNFYSRLIYNLSQIHGFINSDGFWKYAVPFDPKTGNILTSEVLSD